MVLKGQAWHDARERGKRFRAAIAEARLVSEYNRQLDMMDEPANITRGGYERILEAAQNLVRVLEETFEEEE